MPRPPSPRAHMRMFTTSSRCVGAAISRCGGRAMFLGYERETGAAGIRNHVGVMSMLDVANPVVRAICNSVGGTIPITTLFVRGQYGRDLDITYRTLAGLASNQTCIRCCLSDSRQPPRYRYRDDRKGRQARRTVVLQEVGGTIEATTQGIRKAARMPRHRGSARRAAAVAPVHRCRMRRLRRHVRPVGQSMTASSPIVS